MKYLKTLGVFIASAIVMTVIGEVLLNTLYSYSIFVTFVPSIIFSYIMYKKFNNQQ
jgi:hypothetical protein